MLTSLIINMPNIDYTCSECNSLRTFTLNSKDTPDFNCEFCNTFINKFKDPNNNLIKHINTFENLEYLKLNNVLYGESWGNYSLCLSSEKLRYVEINNCPSLGRLNILSELLETIKIKDCPKLE